LQRRAARLLALVALLAAALVPGAVAFSRASAQSCPAPPTDDEFAALVRQSPLIVVGTVRGTASTAEDAGYLDLEPEAYLKGNPSRASIRLTTGLPDVCQSPAIAITAGRRILVMARQAERGLAWPEPRSVYILESGRARSLNRGDSSDIPEASLLARIRAITNQYSVPAASADEGAGIDWLTTVLPVGATVAALMVVGLILMRIWHRIDPS
jgi:hypothetical protein